MQAENKGSQDKDIRLSRIIEQESRKSSVDNIIAQSGKPVTNVFNLSLDATLSGGPDRQKQPILNSSIEGNITGQSVTGQRFNGQRPAYENLSLDKDGNNGQENLNPGEDNLSGQPRRRAQADTTAPTNWAAGNSHLPHQDTPLQPQDTMD